MYCAQVALETVLRRMPIMSFAEIEVAVKSLTVVLWRAVPLVIEIPEVLIESETVGRAAPFAFRHVVKVAVPVSTRMLIAEIVQAKGTVT